MLPLLTRRVALSVYRPTATYTHILLSSVSTLRSRRILYDSLRTGGIQPFANPQRNASTEVTATLNKAKPSTTERKKLGEHLTPEQEKSAKELLQAKKAREKEKEELEKKKKELRREKLAHATAALKAKFKAQEQKEREKQKAREAKKQMSAYTTISSSPEMLCLAIFVVCPQSSNLLRESSTHSRCSSRIQKNLSRRAIPTGRVSLRRKSRYATLPPWPLERHRFDARIRCSRNMSPVLKH